MPDSNVHRYHGKEKYVREIFNNIAHKYDLLNTILSFNFDRYWRRFTVKRANLHEGDRALDVCCGTGMLTIELAKACGKNGHITGYDFSENMLIYAKKNIKKSGYEANVELVMGNAMELPFPENSFDCATIGFGLRNVPDIVRVLKEMQRVVKPGGRVVSLELSKPRTPVFKQLYYLYFDHLVPKLGRMGIGIDGPYRY
ncbi:MAG TPA: ubiquinone/menaquinone biosynthesis methyltransferase, partial [Clostridia bacterium]|nr:ubiquinone/menaquinone biosynthesis methyltransferase [Clostridia bacterium]